MKLYRFEMDCGRMGSVRGTFVARPGLAQQLIGRRVYFGEILGKHSEIEGTIEAGEVTEIDATPAFIEEFQRLFPNGFGYNPLNFVDGG